MWTGGAERRRGGAGGWGWSEKYGSSCGPARLVVTERACVAVCPSCRTCRPPCCCACWQSCEWHQTQARRRTHAQPTAAAVGEAFSVFGWNAVEDQQLMQCDPVGIQFVVKTGCRLSSLVWGAIAAATPVPSARPAESYSVKHLLPCKPFKAPLGHSTNGLRSLAPL